MEFDWIIDFGGRYAKIAHLELKDKKNPVKIISENKSDLLTLYDIKVFFS